MYLKIYTVDEDLKMNPIFLSSLVCKESQRMLHSSMDNALRINLKCCSSLVHLCRNANVFFSLKKKKNAASHIDIYIFLKSANSDMENGFFKNSKMSPKKFIYSGNWIRQVLKDTKKNP